MTLYYITLHFTTLYFLFCQHITLHCQECESDAVCLVQESQKECARLSSQVMKQSSQAGAMQQAVADLQEAKRQADQVGCIPSLCAEARSQSLTCSHHMPL